MRPWSMDLAGCTLYHEGDVCGKLFESIGMCEKVVF